MSKLLASLMRNYFPKRPSGAPLHTLSKLYNVPVGFVTPPPLFWGWILLILRSPKGGCCSISDDLSCPFRFFKNAWIPNQTDCQETFAVTLRHGATPQWRHSKWVTATTRPRTLRLFDVKSTYDIGKTYCQSISAEKILCWHWILCFWKNAPCVEFMDKGLRFLLKHRNVIAITHWI